jgi:hypothetical protein
MLIAARGVAAAFWVFFTVMFHVERSLGLHAAMIHGIASTRCAERRELAVQRGDHQLHRLRRYLADKFSQTVIVKFRCGVVQEQRRLHRRVLWEQLDLRNQEGGC